ncbi:uncharacterized protein MELLADRAFT_59844 [Melampsora larici-populina 98AG31]|uniref:Uncharacterized protein n=1 Tax=Melampsora larici-populina (strain 98AG31 / pathotype 3-4-7) TaxID=747676 RepID=F4R901_MELLP|nr:uncharacterized protein MELLADRAFT_59844 [Melampsora larici-populina 98AG31]EGG11240.1 hypothetical protein MELLADRAFT_59844 [Melampsora larici-populina 98AG31]
MAGDNKLINKDTTLIESDKEDLESIGGEGGREHHHQRSEVSLLGNNKDEAEGDQLSEDEGSEDSDRYFLLVRVKRLRNRFYDKHGNPNTTPEPKRKKGRKADKPRKKPSKSGKKKQTDKKRKKGKKKAFSDSSLLSSGSDLDSLPKRFDLDSDSPSFSIENPADSDSSDLDSLSSSEEETSKSNKAKPFKKMNDYVPLSIFLRKNNDCQGTKDPELLKGYTSKGMIQAEVDSDQNMEFGESVEASNLQARYAGELYSPRNRACQNQGGTSGLGIKPQIVCIKSNQKSKVLHSQKLAVPPTTGSLDTKVEGNIRKFLTQTTTILEEMHKKLTKK